MANLGLIWVGGVFLDVGFVSAKNFLLLFVGSLEIVGFYISIHYGGHATDDKVFSQQPLKPIEGSFVELLSPLEGIAQQINGLSGHASGPEKLLEVETVHDDLAFVADRY